MDNKFNILYLDDEASNLRVFRATFKKFYNVFTAENTQEAFEVLEQNDIHLVVSDQRMPEMTGVQFLEIVAKKYPDIIRIILTAYADTQDIIYAVNRVGIFRFLTKPWDEEDVRAALDNGLERYALKAENLQLLDELKAMNREIAEHSKVMEDINEELDHLVHDLSEKNKNITDSINYAKRIQDAMLPSRELIGNLFPNSFVFYKPRDIVSGDFFWLSSDNNKKLIAAVDCTGHGVPGAFMSILGSVLLNQIVNYEKVWSPAEILNQLHALIVKTLRQKNSEVRDGMDAVVCRYDQQERKMYYAGARNDLFYVKNDQLFEIKADRKSVGGTFTDEKNFTEHVIDVSDCEAAAFYIASDGFQDQFGGAEKKKFSSKKLRETLYEMRAENMQKQGEILARIFEQWISEGREKQIDDVLVIGIRI
jgi:serine phosphatase RsbU (regulator of sigma subunit)